MIITKAGFILKLIIKKEGGETHIITWKVKNEREYMDPGLLTFDFESYSQLF